MAAPPIVAISTMAKDLDPSGKNPERKIRRGRSIGKMVFPGDDLETRIWKVGSRDGVTTYAFETVRGEDFVMTDGLAEIADR